MRKQYAVCFSLVWETIPKANLLEQSMSGFVGSHANVCLKGTVTGGRVQPMYIAMCCVAPMGLQTCCVRPMGTEKCAPEPMGFERCCVQPMYTGLLRMQPMVLKI